MSESKPAEITPEMRALAERVRGFENPEDAHWGTIEVEAAALARLVLGKEPVWEELEGYLEEGHLRDLLDGDVE